VDFTALLVEGNDKRGLGLRFATALAENNINIIFLVAQVIRKKYSAIFGFESKEAAKTAAAVLKKAAKRRR
jgi:predicted amino acid-binding ACT domain protein